MENRYNMSHRKLWLRSLCCEVVPSDSSRAERGDGQENVLGEHLPLPCLPWIHRSLIEFDTKIWLFLSYSPPLFFPACFIMKGPQSAASGPTGRHMEISVLQHRGASRTWDGNQLQGRRGQADTVQLEWVLTGLGNNLAVLPTLWTLSFQLLQKTAFHISSVICALWFSKGEMELTFIQTDTH